MEADLIIIGGGVAGLSLAAAVAPRRKVVLVEAEAAHGVHASGRSATFSHFGIGNLLVRRLTAHARAFFLNPPPGFADHPVARRASALFVAPEPMRGDLEALGEVMAVHAPHLRACPPTEMAVLFPPLRLGPDGIVAGLIDDHGLRLDAETLLQGYARQVRAAGGHIQLNGEASAIERRGDLWHVALADGTTLSAPVLVNAAGAWADRIAAAAQVPTLGLAPLRRTIILVDPPAGADVRHWPFVKTAVDDFYILPQGGQLAASPVDEVPSEPMDAQPDDYDIALAASKVEHYTHLPVPRVTHRWAGLRTFAPDRSPVIGFDPRAPGFFWLAGQGGFGLQTAPALAEAAAALILGDPWPQGLAAAGVSAHDLSPERLIHG